jgi:hypothetical protein
MYGLTKYAVVVGAWRLAEMIVPDPERLEVPVYVASGVMVI